MLSASHTATAPITYSEGQRKPPRKRKTSPWRIPNSRCNGKIRGQSSLFSPCSNSASPFPCCSSGSHVPSDSTHSETAESKDLGPHANRHSMLKENSAVLQLPLQNSCLFCSRYSRFRSVAWIFERCISLQPVYFWHTEVGQQSALWDETWSPSLCSRRHHGALKLLSIYMTVIWE